jgi:hypothetical protein
MLNWFKTIGVVKNFKIYRKCPEIRHCVRYFYAAKISMCIIAVFLSPLFTVAAILYLAAKACGIVSECMFTLCGSPIEYFSSTATDSITKCHAILPVSEIQERVAEK